MSKVFHWKLCKKLEFDFSNKWNTRNPEAILENVTHKNLLDFEVQADHLISARGPDLVIVNKKENLSNSGPCRTGKPQSKIERK